MPTRGSRVGIVLGDMPRPADSLSTHRVVQSTRNDAESRDTVKRLSAGPKNDNTAMMTTTAPIIQMSLLLRVPLV